MWLNRKLNTFLTTVAVIFTRLYSLPLFLAVTACKKTLSDTGRQEIKYNAVKKSRTRRGSLGAAVTANSSKLPTKLQSSRGQLDLVYL